MNVTLKLTMDGLIEALRWKALERQSAREDGKPLARQTGPEPKLTEADDGK